MDCINTKQADHDLCVNCDKYSEYDSKDLMVSNLKQELFKNNIKQSQSCAPN